MFYCVVYMNYEVSKLFFIKMYILNFIVEIVWYKIL